MLTLNTEFEDANTVYAKIFKDGELAAYIEMEYDYGESLCGINVIKGKLSDEDLMKIEFGDHN